MLAALTEDLRHGKSLTPEVAEASVQELVAERDSTAIKAAFLEELAKKGETVEEIVAFARELRRLAVRPPIDEVTRAGDILDVCGTGGDRLNTFNISTTVALVAASAGIPVAKHGNRAVTSQAGSADVLEALGIAIELPPSEAVAQLRECKFAFFFAPKYHPAFRHIGPARRLCAERGQRTIFNILGPLLNPAEPTAQLVGVPRPVLCETMGRALQALGLRRGVVVSGAIGGKSGEHAFLDEFSILGDNTVAEFYQSRAFVVSTLAPTEFPLQPAVLADLGGTDARGNAEIIRRIIQGDERGPKRDAVLLNAAAALHVAGQVRSFLDGWDRAVELIDGGAAAAKLAELVKNS